MDLERHQNLCLDGLSGFKMFTSPASAPAKPIFMAFCWVEGQTALDSGTGEPPFNQTYTC
jgi:hypothetical protein